MKLLASDQFCGSMQWLDPERLKADYVPKGFHIRPGPIQGHPFGLNIPVADRQDLIAFLKTL
jgi:hypothetical protein